MISKLKSFLAESKTEFNRINWPSLQSTVRMTGVVIGLSLFVALFLGVLDFIFTAVLEQIL